MNCITRKLRNAVRIALILASATPLFIYAQEADEYVHDVLTVNTVFTTNPYKTAEFPYTYNGQGANYIGRSVVEYAREKPYFSFAMQGTKKTYLACNTSNGYICRRISYTGDLCNGGRIDIYGSDDIFMADAFLNGKIKGTLITSIRENNGSITLPAGAMAYRNYCLIPDGGANELYSIDFAYQRAYSRSDLSVNSLGTICLPYAVKKEDLRGITPYSIVGKKLDTDGSPKQIVFGEVEEMEAGTPYVFIANESNFTLPLSGSTAVAMAGSHNGLVGTFSDHAFADDANYDNNYYIISASNGVQAASNKSGVKANRAYIRMDQVPTLSNAYNPSGSALRTLILTNNGFDVVNGTTTSISSASTAVTKSAAYTLDGRALNSNSALHGVNIVAGRKQMSIKQH